MFKKNKENFSIILFIMSSFFALIVFVMIVFVFLSNVKYDNSNQIKSVANKNIDSKIFLNLDYEDKDPYTTKIPNLKDMLAGPVITNLDPSLGDVNSPVTLVLFSDFECLYCAKQEELLKEVLGKYDIRLVWKDYPASDINSMSFKAAVAARCAQVENAFWDYHDLLFKSDSNISEGRLNSIAEELHLDLDEFSDCLNNSFTAQLVYDNMLEAEALGINGIPFLYINDQEILGEIDKEDLERVIELELEKVK